MRPIVFQLRFRDHFTLLKELLLSRHECFVATSTLFFFLLFLLSHDINFCCDFSFCRDTSLCRSLVCISLKINEQTAFHSSASLKFAASIKSTPHKNSNIYYIQFSKNLDKEKNAPPFFFQIAFSCEFLEWSWNCFFFFSLCIFARAFCNIEINSLSKQKLTSKVLTNHKKKLEKKINQSEF